MMEWTHWEVKEMSWLKDITWTPADYKKAAFFARAAGEEMLERLDWIKLHPRFIIDMGAGPGWFTERLKEKYKEATVFALDLTLSMLQSISSKAVVRLCADAVSLPFKNGTLDLIFANLLLPWTPNIHLLLKEWQRVLRPEGLLMLTILGPQTLQESAALISSAYLPFLWGMPEMGDLLLENGFIDPVIDTDCYIAQYDNPMLMMKDLLESGMVEKEQCKSILTAELPMQLTYEIIYAHAFGSDQTLQKNSTVSVPLSEIGYRFKTEK